MASSNMTTSATASAAGAKKPSGRFETLDGMRGLAAFAVVLLHLTAGLPIGVWHPNFATLAVDIFFALSGFVLAYSYDKRFAGGLTVWKFMSMRTRRLFPLYLVGFTCGLFAMRFLQEGVQGQCAWYFTYIPNLLLLPTVCKGMLFPVNGPAWSLFFEFWVANLVFALIWRWLHGWRMWVLLGISLGGVLLALYRLHTLHVGFDQETLLYGIPRTCFSFFAGVAVARYHQSHKPKLRVPAIIVVLAMLVVLCMPAIILRWYGAPQAFQLLAVLVIFPVLLYFGAETNERHSPALEWLGDTSYAVYVIHWPILVGVTALLAPLGWVRSLWLELVLASAVMILAYWAHHWLDVPVRRWIARKWPL